MAIYLIIFFANSQIKALIIIRIKDIVFLKTEDSLTWERAGFDAVEGSFHRRGTVAGAFTASETLDVGVNLGSPVSLDYFDRRPFAFNGKINSVTVDLK